MTWHADLSISAEEIDAFHTRSLSTGGLPGIRLSGCVDSAIDNAKSAELYSGNEDGTLGICFIASLMFYLNKNQCYADANKRTSLTVALALLAKLGLTLSVSAKDLEEYCYEIATNTQLTSSDVVRWIAEHSVGAD